MILITKEELAEKIKHYDNSHEWSGEDDEIYMDFAKELKGIYKKTFGETYYEKRDPRRKCGHCYQPLEIRINYPIVVKKYIKRLDGGNRYLCNYCYKNLIERYENEI